MSKIPFLPSTISGQFRSRQSTTDELEIFRTVVSVLKKDPEKLRAVAVKAGISTRAGKLKKAYRD